jgi:hypothetical protein
MMPAPKFYPEFTVKPNPAPVYIDQNSGFNTLEFLLGMYAIQKSQVGKPDPFDPFKPESSVTITLLPMKTPYYTKDEFLNTLAGSLAFFFLLTFFTPMYRMISFVIEEKSSRAREGMKIMGLTDLPYWLSWFLYYFLVSTIISVVGAGILKINIFVYTPYWMLLAFLWLYGMALFSLSMLIICFIERP